MKTLVTTMRKQDAEQTNPVKDADIRCDMATQSRTYVWGDNSGAHGVQQVQECGLPLLPGGSHSCHGIVQSC